MIGVNRFSCHVLPDPFVIKTVYVFNLNRINNKFGFSLPNRTKFGFSWDIASHYYSYY